MSESFKARMKRLRLQAGYKSQQDAATAIGAKNRGIVSMWEAPSSHVESVSGEYLLQTAKVYKVRPEYINSGKGGDGFPWNGYERPISPDAAQSMHPALPRTRRVEIRGNAIMDKDGFWKELAQSNNDEWQEWPSADPQAYAIRIIGIRYRNVIRSGRCILVEPGKPLKVDDLALVTMCDGRHVVRDFISHADGYWMLASVSDANDRLQLADSEVLAVHRITNVFDTD